jgi:non-specific serine/threonine protein kinase
MSGFVGRRAELTGVREVLRRSRLVTVTGAGGVGKTRLALRAADEARADFRDGVVFIELSAVRDPGLLGAALSAALASSLAGAGPEELEPDPGEPLDELLAFLRERELLLIFDTCEHLVDGCAALAETILREAPGVTILATSRQPLDAAGEAAFRLAPLPVPDADSAGPSDAVELFAQRAAAAVPGFTVTAANRADVITICRRLDGIPLAIELAAVRLRALPLHQMAERIQDRLRLLTGERRSGTPRHQTLRAAIDWSYSLCPPAEQLLWARLSVFAGGFDLAAAEAVGAGGELPAAAVVPAVISLIDRNVLVREDTDDRPAFRLPDTLREFGAERLAEAEPAPDAVRRRFIAHYLALAEQFDATAATDQLARYQQLYRQHANLQAAFDYALELAGNDGAAIALATSLFVYWRISGLLREGEYWLDQVVLRCPPGSAARARVLGTRGYIRILLGDFARGRADAESAVSAAATFGDLAAGGRGYSALHRVLTFSGSLAEAQDAARPAAACLDAAGDTLGLAQLDAVDAIGRLQAGDPGRCYESAARGLARLPGDELWCAASLYGLQALGLFLAGDIDRAKAPACHALELQEQVNDLTGIAFGLGTLAFIAAGEGRYERTAWLLGASAPLWERTGRWYTGAPAFESLHQVAQRVARAALGDDRFWQLQAAGAAVQPGQAIRRALNDVDETGALA